MNRRTVPVHAMPASTRAIPPLVGALLLAISSLVAAPVAAQSPREGHPAYDGAMPRAGVSFLYAVPQGEFADHVSEGWGISLFGRLPTDRRGVLSVRVEGGFVNYGRERIRECLTTCRLQVDVTTSNDILFAGIGPEIGTLPGPLRLYAAATAGVAYFTTTSSIAGTEAIGDFARSENFGDAVFAWRAGGGLQFRLRDGWRPIDLDLSATYHANDPATYLVQGGIQDHPDGSITVFPRRSDTDLVTIQVGFTIGLGRGAGAPPKGW